MDAPTPTGDGPKWPEHESATHESSIDMSVEAAYTALQEGRLSRMEYDLVLNRHMERQKDWGTMP